MLLTLAILVTMVYAAANILRSGFDLKDSLGQESKVTQRMGMVLDGLNRDLTGAYIVNSTDSRRSSSGKARTAFRITKGSGSDTLVMTYVGHKALIGNSKESDLSLVKYEVQEDPDNPKVKHLYRGEFPRIPEDLNATPPMEIFAEDIAAITFEFWNGDGWSKDKWDSTTGDTKNKLPQMVRIQVTSYEDAAAARGADVPSDVSFGTVVYLPYALDSGDIRSRVNSFKID